MIHVALSAADITIEPGGTAQLTVAIKNDQTHDDHLFIEIEGLDVEWYALPVASLTIPAGFSHEARVLFKVARDSANTAGTYPYIVRVRSMETGDFGFKQAVLLVKPFSALQLELDPKRTTCSFLRSSAYVEISVTNLSNHDETLDLYGADPEDGCAFEFETERITIKPGHTEAVGLTLEPVTRPILGSSRLYGYNVTARSTRDTFVSGTAHGQLERRAMLSIFALVFLMLVAAGGIAGVLLWPRPITIHSFTANPRQITAGESTTLGWDVSNATDGITVLPDGFKAAAPNGVTKLAPTQSTTYTLLARSGAKEVRETVTVVVVPAPLAPLPRIVSFIASTKRVHEGETVHLAWKVLNAKTIMLNPLNKQDDPTLFTSYTDKPETTITYELAARGPGGTVSQSITVEVVKGDQSTSSISYFNAKPDKIYSGEKTTLSWTAENAAVVEIEGIPGVQKSKGSLELKPTVTMTYTLRAIDTKGVFTTKTVTVFVADPPILPPVDGVTPKKDPLALPGPKGTINPIPNKSN